MRCLLTSTLGTHVKNGKDRCPIKISNENALLDNLLKEWVNNARILVIGSDPNQTQVNDSIIAEYKLSFRLSDLSFSKIDICDKRDFSFLNKVFWYDVIIFPGGHVGTQNKFYHDVGIKQKIECYKGLVLTASAGTMNMSKTVLNPPTFQGETLDMSYKMTLKGLGFSSEIYIPHFSEVIDQIVDGKNIFTEYILPWSNDFRIIGINDGTYITITDGNTKLWGEAFEICNNGVRKICNIGETIEL